MVVGKVVMRIPWFGWITLFMRDNSWGLPVVIALILLLVIVEFVVPILRERKNLNNKITTQPPATDVFIKSAFDKGYLRAVKARREIGCQKLKLQ